MKIGLSQVASRRGVLSRTKKLLSAATSALYVGGRTRRGTTLEQLEDRTLFGYYPSPGTPVDATTSCTSGPIATDEAAASTTGEPILSLNGTPVVTSVDLSSNAFGSNFSIT